MMKYARRCRRFRKYVDSKSVSVNSAQAFSRVQVLAEPYPSAIFSRALTDFNHQRQCHTSMLRFYATDVSYRLNIRNSIAAFTEYLYIIEVGLAEAV